MDKKRDVRWFLKQLKKARKTYPFELVPVYGSKRDRQRVAHRSASSAIWNLFDVVWRVRNPEGPLANRERVHQELALSSDDIDQISFAVAQVKQHDKKLRKKILKACGIKET